MQKGAYVLTSPKMFIVQPGDWRRLKVLRNDLGWKRIEVASAARIREKSG